MHGGLEPLTVDPGVAWVYGDTDGASIARGDVMDERLPSARRSASHPSALQRFGRCVQLLLPLPLVLPFIFSLISSPVSAQYFGRNKVQYKPLDYQVMKTEHFDIYFYPSAREGVEISARMAERWLTRLEQQLNHQLRGRQPLILYASHPDFQQTNVIGGEIGEGTGGVTEALRRRIVLPLAGPLADTDHVIGHELVHAFQYDMTTRPDAGPGQTGANALPLWFIEGMAEYLSIGPVDPHTSMWLRDAARGDELPTIRDLNDPRYFPYRWGQAFWAYVAGTYGEDVIPRMLTIAGAAGDPREAFKQILGVTEDELTQGWHAAIRATYAEVLRKTTPPNEVGTVILSGDGAAGNLNVGPSVSPDGSLVAFLSERSLLSVDLFVAETATGKVLHRLTSTATSPHLSSLQFIYSAGTWDPTSRRVAVATIADGQAAIAIYDARTGDQEREVVVSDVDEILNPNWSPDGNTIVFTGMARGLTDLYLLDLKTGTVKPLMQDPFADLQPAWSPDGRRIAFVTDRFSSRLDVLAIGDYRLALVDAASGTIEQVRAFTSGKNINPQWAPDGRSIYFISDRDGISNLYRVSLDGEIEQLTTINTGLTGITAESPVLSVASRSGLAAVTVYDRGNHHIHTLDVSERGRPLADASGPGRAELPPTDRRASSVAAMLRDPLTGLPPATRTYETSDYKARLTLDAIGQPSIAFGADRFGAALGGGLSFQFSDMLGNHTLTAAVNLSQGIGGNFALSNTAAQAAYFNQTHRWNWGIVGGQVPYVSGGFQSGVATVDGERALIDQTIVLRQTQRSASGLVAYPFSRSRRVEFQGGFSQLAFDQIVQTQGYSLATGRLILDEVDKTQIGDTLSLGTASAALVFDTSTFGATSPVAGARYRFEAAPTFGSVRYTSLLADYRRYLMPVSFYTIAIRAMHYGRYGTGGGDERLFPLFVGYPNLVRGYDVYSFAQSECVPTATSECPAFDRLLGTRTLIGNIELRFPLLRPFGVSQAMYSPLPLEVALFADGGVAWNGGERPSFLGGDRHGVSSLGVALRANLMGFAIGEFAFSRPQQRPGRGWMFQFNLSPGF
ncbi:MAG: peptidase S9 [Vicinamibacterales bacterium]